MYMYMYMYMAAQQTILLKLLELFAELFLWFPAKCNWFLSLTFYTWESVVLENRKWMSREVSGFTWRFATTTSLFGTKFYAWSWTQSQGITLQGMDVRKRLILFVHHLRVTCVYSVCDVTIVCYSWDLTSRSRWQRKQDGNVTSQSLDWKYGI